MDFLLKFLVSSHSGVLLFILLLANGQTFWWALLAGYIQAFGGLLASVATRNKD